MVIITTTKGSEIDRNMDPGLVSPPKLYFLDILGIFYIEKSVLLVTVIYLDSQAVL